MTERTRIILGIAGLAAATVLIGLAIYFTFFRPPGPPTANVPEGNVPVNGALPNVNAAGNVNRGANANAGAGVNGALPEISEIAKGGATRTLTVVGDAVQAVTTGSNSRDVLYYNPADGKFYRVAADGQTKSLLSNQTFPEVASVRWSPDKGKAILTFPDDTNLLVDFAKNTQTTLPKELREFSFAPASDKIAAKYVGAAPSDRWLVVANPDGSQAQIIEALGDQADRVTTSWSPNNQVIATFQKSTGAETQDIIFLGKQNENFPALPVEGRGFLGQWSPEGQRMLYSVSNAASSYAPELYLVDAQGDATGSRKTKLDLATWADKCSFSQGGSALYCAEPQYVQPGAGLRPEIARGVPDRFFRLDLTTGAKTLLAVPVDENGTNRFSARDLFVTDAEDQLVFTDWVSGKVHRIRLR